MADFKLTNVLPLSVNSAHAFVHAYCGMLRV